MFGLQALHNIISDCCAHEIKLAVDSLQKRLDEMLDLVIDARNDLLDRSSELLGFRRACAALLARGIV